MIKKGAIEFEKIIVLIIALIVLTLIIVFFKGKSQEIIASFLQTIKQIFK